MSRLTRGVRRFYHRVIMMFRGRVFFTPTSALLRRVVIYGILLFFITIIQTSLPFIPVFEGAVPNLTLAAVAAIGFFDSERAGAVAGIAAGAALDALGSATLSLMPLAGFAAGYFSGFAAGRLLPRALRPFSICLASAAVLNMFVSVVSAYAAVSEVRPLLFFAHTLLPELLYTFIFGIPAALLAYLCSGLAGKSARDRSFP